MKSVFRMLIRMLTFVSIMYVLTGGVYAAENENTTYNENTLAFTTTHSYSYDSVGDFHEGLAWAYKDRQEFRINYLGDIVIRY